MTAASQAIGACVLGVLALIAFDRLGWPRARAAAKLAASSAFVALALVLGALQSGYGRWILAALLLGWVGDALLLSRQARVFMAGLGVFLLSHLCFAVAFIRGGPLASGATVAAGAALLAFGWGVLRWLLPHAPAEFRWPVKAYVVVILLMCTAAIGHAAATGRGWTAVGALLFAASDLAVARERFVQRGFINQLWGWPAYYAAQLLLAGSVAAATGSV